MTSLRKTPLKKILAATMVVSLLGFSGCADDADNVAQNTERTSVASEKPAPAENIETPVKQQQRVPEPSKKIEKTVDWDSVLEDPTQYLLTASGFPKAYKPRILTLSERGQAIQDVGRAGIGVSNFPCECDGAGGRIGNDDDKLAMQMAAHGNNSLTLVVIDTAEPKQAVSEWAEKNQKCPSFLSKENGITSKVLIKPLKLSHRAGREVAGFKITTITQNLHGTMVQEQILFAVALNNVVVEVMGMSFNQEADEEKTLALLDKALARAEKIEKKELPADQLVKEEK